MHIIHTNTWTRICVWMLVSVCVSVCVCLHRSRAERSTLTNDYCGTSDIAVCVCVRVGVFSTGKDSETDTSGKHPVRQTRRMFGDRCNVMGGGS